MERHDETMRRFPQPVAARLAALLTIGSIVASAAGCGETPTEFNPIARVVGHVNLLGLQVSNLLPLDPENDGVYELWAFDERNSAISMGQFNIGAGGQIVDLDGNPIERFESGATNIADAVSALITVEPPLLADDGIVSGFRLLQGPFDEGVARLSVPAPQGTAEASGAYRVFTPTDGPGTNENSGAWAVAADGTPLLSLPALNQLFRFEAFVILAGMPVSMGFITSDDQADSGNPFSGPQAAPTVPGEDFLVDPPDGLAFPTDLSGVRLVITLEPNSADVVGVPTQLVVLAATLPPGLVGGEIVDLVNRAGSFPTGTAVMF